LNVSADAIPHVAISRMLMTNQSVRMKLFLLLLPFFLSLPLYVQAHDLPSVLSEHAISFETAGDFMPLFNEISGQRLILLGESSHGTSEFYVWRAELSKYLVKQKGFNFIAVEGDWPAFSRLNAYVKHKPGAPGSIHEAMAAIDRWPQWMWRNREFKRLVAWLHDFNSTRDPGRRVGLYGIDLYAKQDAMREVISWSASVDEAKARNIERLYACLSGFSHARDYIVSIRETGENCSSAVEYVLGQVRGLSRQDPDIANSWEYFNAEQNAKLVVHAERHYRANLERGASAWNHRAAHFELTAKRLLDFYGDDSSGIVWAHNTHVGDARATDMAHQGMKNVGQLSRERWGADKIYAIGFGTYEGNVYAAREWEGVRETMPTPQARPDSWEFMLQATEQDQFYLLFSSDGLRQALAGSIPHRAIGVTFNPGQERRNYVNSILPERYNAFIFIRETDVLAALD
jgi:erythromycin esterase